jgi:hypothetical protein
VRSHSALSRVAKICPECISTRTLEPARPRHGRAVPRIRPRRRRRIDLVPTSSFSSSQGWPGAQTSHGGGRSGSLPRCLEKPFTLEKVLFALLVRLGLGLVLVAAELDAKLGFGLALQTAPEQGGEEREKREAADDGAGDGTGARTGGGCTCGRRGG